MSDLLRSPAAQPFFFPGNTIGCLLIHGLTSTPYEVRELGDRLHAVGHSVAGIRLPGHGTRYQDLDTVPWTHWSEAVELGYELLTSRCEQVFIMGVSMGATLALITASRRPVAGVVSISGLWGFSTWQVLGARLLARVQPHQRKRRGSSIADPVARVKHPSYSHMPMRAVLQSNAALAAMREALPRVTAPALLVHSRHDPVAPPAGVPNLLAALGSQDKQVHWVTRSEHILTEDYDKEEVFKVIVEWVRTVANSEEVGGEDVGAPT